MLVPCPRPDQRGFSLVEVMVAITILLVGVLGVVAMVDGASAVTGKNKAREGGTNVARSIIEVGRAVRYRDLTADQLIAALDTRPGLADASPDAGHSIESRGVLYDVTVEVCSMDDPRDSLGLETAGITFCAESVPAATPSDAKDRNPDDYKRVSVTLTWDRGGGTEKVKQTSLVSNPVGGLGPSITELFADGFTGTSVTVTSETTDILDFTARTSTDAAQVNWSLNGDVQDQADPLGASERDWTFEWDINGVGTGKYWYDCTYIVQAEAYDEEGRSGKPAALTVVLNRRQPFAPKGFQGGRNGNGSRVDLRWQQNAECDVLGYRVYRRVGATGTWEQVTCFDQASSEYTTATDCLDEGAPAPGPEPLQYRVVAVDTAPGTNALRDGDDSTVLQMLEGNAVPAAPTNLSACLGGPGCYGPDGLDVSSGVTVLHWSGSTDPDGDPIAFYRVYRDGTTYAERVGIFFPGSAGNLAWIDPDSPDGSHTYRLTAVDASFGESALSDPVTFPTP